MEYKLVIDPDKETKDCTIEKRGHVVTFTMDEVEAHEKQLQQKLKELKSLSELHSAKMTNIETHHPFVKDMSEQDLFTAHMYQEAKALVGVADSKIEEIEKQLQEYADEKVEIKRQIPELADVVSSIQPQDIKA